MVDVNQQRILQLAQQGNRQAIAMILNRPLIPKGAHVKIRANADCLQVLLEFPNRASKADLLPILEQQIFHLQLSTFRTVKIYAPKPGTSRASLIHSFKLNPGRYPASTDHNTDAPLQSQAPTSTPPVAEILPHPLPHATTVPIDATPVSESPAPALPTHNSPLTPATPATQAPPRSVTQSPPARRLSFIDFLAQAKTLEDLQGLQNHPFLTGHCPQCGAPYADSGTLHPYWDCTQCGWQDNLGQLTSDRGGGDQPTASHHESKRLGSYLIEAGLLNEAQIQVALADQEMTGMRLGEALVRRGWIKEETIEYLMQKVILPERHASEREHNASELELSQSLVQALVRVMAPAAQQVDSHASTPVSPPISISKQQVRELIHAEVQKPSPQPAATTQAGAPNASVLNERSTLVLPNLDLSEHLEDDDLPMSLRRTS